MNARSLRQWASCCHSKPEVSKNTIVTLMDDRTTLRHAALSSCSESQFFQGNVAKHVGVLREKNDLPALAYTKLMGSLNDSVGLQQ
jgi:hypothetical protein